MTIHTKSKNRRRILVTFEFCVTVGMILFGMILLIGGLFAVTIFIPQNLGGIWASMDCHLKLTFHATMTWALAIGVILISSGGSLLLHSIRRIPTSLPSKLSFPRSLNLKCWTLFQILTALFIIAFTLIRFFDVTVFGGPYGCGHYHLIPLYFPVAVLLVEIPAILLALFTYWRLHFQFLTGWIFIGTLRLFLGIIFLVIPWYYLIEPFTIINDISFNILALTAGWLTFIGAILQYLTFSKISSSE